MKQWESFDFASKRISAADVAKAEGRQPAADARHCFRQARPHLQRLGNQDATCESRDWYKPNPNFKNSALNDTERDNLDVIRIAEAEHHETVQPGDMRLYQNRAADP